MADEKLTEVVVLRVAKKQKLLFERLAKAYKTDAADALRRGMDSMIDEWCIPDFKRQPKPKDTNKP